MTTVPRPRGSRRRHVHARDRPGPPRDPETTALILLGALIDAAMQIVVAEDRAVARGRSEAVIVDLLEGLRR